MNKVGLTEKLFDEIRKQMNRAAVTQAVNINLTKLPKVMQETYFNYLNQKKRDIDVVTIQIENIANFPAPSEEVLKKFYNEHRNIAQAQETRTFDSIIFDFEKVASKIKVTDEELKDNLQSPK